MKAEFVNPKGYHAPWDHNEFEIWPFRKAVFDFHLDPVAPLTFRRASGELVQPDRHFMTDWGSIPVILRPIIGHDTYPMCYAFHDSAYNNHGLHFAFPALTGRADFAFKSLTMHESNALLHEMMEAQGAWGLTADAVFWTLEAVGCFAWRQSYRREQLRKGEA